MKKVIAWVLTLALVATVSIGATLAYLTDTDEDVNVMTLGKVKIDQLEYERIDDETKDADAKVQEFHDNKPLYPGVYKDDFSFAIDDTNPVVDWAQIGKDGYDSGIWDPEKINNELDKMVFVKNKGDYEAYVRSVFAFEAGNYETLDEFKSMVHLNLNDTDWTWEWLDAPVIIGENKYFVATATYNKVLAPGALTEISLSQIALDKTATNEDVKAFGDTYHVLVKSQAIQADGFTDPEIALNDGFGEITKASIPFETDQPIQGLDLRSALRFYQGNAAQPIHSNVTDVVFGLNKDYPNIVNNYDGTLVTEEQDVEVHSYYVQENNQYTVYFLSNGKVNFPKDSSRLFQEMSKLTTVDTSNLNTGNAELMNHLFFKCHALKNIDVSNFDTGNATTMRSLFNQCYALESVDISQWDTSNVTDMSYLFRTCTSMTEVDMSGLDVSNVTNMEYMFSFSDKLKKVDTTGWDTRSVTSTKAMFMNCYKLEEVIGSGEWKLFNNTNMYYMFQNCNVMEYLDVTNWDCSNVTTMQGSFIWCYALKTLEGLENWNTSKVTTMYGLFNMCYALADADVSNFKTGNVQDMAFLFFACHSLPEVDVSKWDTGNVKHFNSMFSGNGHNTGEMLFTHLPVENWDVSSAVNMECMFYGCGRLTELDLSKWDTGNVTNFRHTFADCFKLKTINFSNWDTGSATTFDGLFNDCTSLTDLDLSDFDTGNATNFAQFFEGCESLKTVKGMENWDTSKVLYMAQLFNANGKNMQLEYVDLSAFDTSSVIDTSHMFNGCTKLTTVYVGDGWDMSKVTSSGAMFSACSSLVGQNGTTTAGNPADVTYACVDTPEAPGYLTYKAPAEG